MEGGGRALNLQPRGLNSIRQNDETSKHLYESEYEMAMFLASMRQYVPF
jgi:hypothetical protein